MNDTQTRRAGIILVVAILASGLGVGIAIVGLTGGQSAPMPPVTAVDQPQPAQATSSSASTTADFYRDIGGMLKVDCPASSNLMYPGYPPFRSEWDQMAKAAWDAEQPALARLREARSIQWADWPDPKADNARHGGVSYLNLLRNIANHLGDAALYQHLQGNDAAAIDIVGDLFVLSDLLEQKTENSVIRLLVGTGIRALTANRILIIASGVALTNDPADHQKLQADSARRLIKKLLIQNDANTTTGPAASWVQSVSRASTERVIETLNRANAEQTFAAMSMACHLFLLDHNRWPNLIDEFVPAYLPHKSIDPWGDGHQMIGYVLVKGGLPDGSDRPMVYSRCSSKDGLFYRVNEPEYGFYQGDPNNPDPALRLWGGQFRDVASWVPAAGGIAGPTTRPLL